MSTADFVDRTVGDAVEFERRVLVTIGLLARGFEFLLPPVAEMKEDFQDPSKDTSVASIFDPPPAEVITRVSGVSNAPATPQSGQIREIGGKIGYTRSIPRFVLQMEFWDQLEELKRALVGLICRGLIIVHRSEFNLPGHAGTYRTQSGITWHVSLSPLEPAASGIGRNRVRIQRNNFQVADFVSLGEWYTLTPAGWEEANKQHSDVPQQEICASMDKEMTLAEASREYEVPNWELSRAARKSPCQVGHLPTRRQGSNVLVTRRNARQFAESYAARREQRATIATQKPCNAVAGHQKSKKSSP